MRLTSAHVQHFKSIADSGTVSVDPRVTVLVGQNEAGKSAFLSALYKARPADGGAKFDREMDYPRGSLLDYDELHSGKSAVVAVLSYELDEAEVQAVNAALGCEALKLRTFTVTHAYAGSTIAVVADERAYARHLVTTAKVPDGERTALGAATSARALWTALGAAAVRGPAAEALFAQLDAQFKKATVGWQGADYVIWTTHLERRVPRFVYFDDYRILPGRVNLLALQKRVAAAGDDLSELDPKDLSVLGLLRMAKVTLDELVTAKSYESITARLEGFSNKVTDRVFRYWKQNDQLEVKIDVRLTPEEPAPYNTGPNLAIRIYNRRHRVTVGFDQRSRGFIWFFSFLVWFDSVKQQLGTEQDLVLLLDEPGLSLHALAQADFLRYIDDLAAKHQTLYSTHSPFMVHGDRLHQVRLVEDRPEAGTTVTDDVTGSDPKTVFPLQAALGYTIAQNLFISRRNLLVEGPADLVYLQQASAALEALGRTGLRADVTVVPAGGLDNVATFVALLGGNDLEFVVLHDLANKPHQRIEQLQRDKLVREKVVLNYGQFRAVAGAVGGRVPGGAGDPAGNGAKRPPRRGARAGSATAATLAAPAAATAVPVNADGDKVPSTDVEDLFSPALYLELFNGTFANALGGTPVREADLPPGDRIVERITRYLSARGVSLRPSGGFNHYAVANHMAAHPPAALDAATLGRFEALFTAVNALYLGGA